MKEPTTSSQPIAPRAAGEDSMAAVAQLESIVSNVLRYGVLLSFTIIAIGSVLLFATGRSPRLDLVYHPMTQSFGSVFGQVGQLEPTGVINLGLVLLILTPVFRVAVSVIGFLFEKDYLYTAVTLFVLSMLILSMFLGAVE